jgi:hypothetical protein
MYKREIKLDKIKYLLYYIVFLLLYNTWTDFIYILLCKRMCTTLVNMIFDTLQLDFLEQIQNMLHCEF